MTQPAGDRLEEKRSDLRHLEKVAARIGRVERFDILLQIDGLQREIAVLEQTIEATSADSQ